MTQHNVTMAEMALRLGVSNATVANALSGRGRVSAEVTARVKALARELNYVPNTAARMLRTNRKDSVGVLLTTGLTNPWYSQLIDMVDRILSSRGLSMMLILGQGDPEKSHRALVNFLGGDVGGILAGPVFRQRDLEYVQPAVSHGVPVVAFNSLEDLPLNLVNIDQAVGAYLAVSHLAELGHRHIMYLGSPDQHGGTYEKGTRCAGFYRGIQAFGLNGECLPTDKPVSRREGYEMCRHLLEQRRREDLPSALFCHNDDMALGTMLCLLQSGLRVPDDISVIGFDDISESSISLPGLTTVGGVMHELAVALVDMLQGLHAGEKDFHRQLIQPKLVVRSSTGQVREYF